MSAASQTAPGGQSGAGTSGSATGCWAAADRDTASVATAVASAAPPRAVAPRRQTAAVPPCRKARPRLAFSCSARASRPAGASKASSIDVVADSPAVSQRFMSTHSLANVLAVSSDAVTASCAAPGKASRRRLAPSPGCSLCQPDEPVPHAAADPDLHLRSLLKITSPTDRRSIHEVAAALSPNSGLCARSRGTHLAAPRRSVGKAISIRLLSAIRSTCLGTTPKVPFVASSCAP